MDPTDIDPNGSPEDAHDGGLSAHYARVAAAETRLRTMADLVERSGTGGPEPSKEEFPYGDDGWEAFAADVRLILSELNGLKQFDPR